MRDYALPFPRGSTYSAMGAGPTMTASYADHIEGRVFEVPDTVHNTGQNIKLRVVRNATGAAMIAAAKICRFRETTALDFGRKVVGFAGAGQVGKVLDDAYTAGSSIPANDLFYVVESGYVNVLTSSDGAVALPAGTAVASDDEGRLSGARAAAGEYIVGTITEACILANTTVEIYANEGLDNASA